MSLSNFLCVTSRRLVLPSPQSQWGLSACLFSGLSLGVVLSVSAQMVPRATTPSAFVGAAMAVLATLAEAQVLPEQDTPEANRLIKTIIQCQSLLVKSPDPFVQGWLRQAWKAHDGHSSEMALLQFRSSGWTSEWLLAFEIYWQQTSPDQRVQLIPALTQFNLTLEDLDWFMERLQTARTVYQQRGEDMQQVFAQHRRFMPGAQRSPQPGGEHGNTSLYFNQSESWANQKSSAGH